MRTRLLLLLALLMTVVTGAWAQTSDMATPLTLQAMGNGKITIYKPKVGMKYKVDDDDKQTVQGTGDVSITVTAGQTVQFFGNGTSITAYSDGSSYYTRIGSNVSCCIYGNIMSLVDETGFATATVLTGDYAFFHLFYSFKTLLNHPSRKLVLPATTLTTRCYFGMFTNCTSLTTAPELPATTLAEGCYFGMFMNCTSLTTAPELPATTLADACYNNMFSDCTKLNAVTCLATDISAQNATYNWLASVAPSGTLTIAKGMKDKWTANSPNGIPQGWSAEVTFRVKLAYGTEDADKWTATVGTSTTAQPLPVTGLNEGDAVTMKYNGRLKVKSVTATTPVPLTQGTGEKINEWTLTNKMPAGNVTVNVNYFPKAEFAMSTGTTPWALTPPPSNNDILATTDVPLVGPGTVADIPGSTDGKKQGTVMFYVSTTGKLTEDQLIALVNEGKWSSDVPTAADINEACEAYVYFYIKGNDGDTDETTFSDGDILATNFVQVTLGDAPTYAAEFDLTNAHEEDKTGKWSTNIPEGGVIKGTPVTVTYSGAKKIIGVKAEKKKPLIVNPEMGQFIGSDGKNYDANATLPDGVTAVAKICYVGSDNGEAPPYNHGLALALSDANSGSTCMWKTENTDAGHTKQTSRTFTEESGLQYNDTHNSATYPAFKAAIANNGTAAPTGCSSWFLASGYQWQKMISAAGLSNLGLQSAAFYWSSSEYSASNAWGCLPNDGAWLNGVKFSGYRVRACLAF